MSTEGRGRSALAPHRSIHKVVNRISACMGFLGLLSLRSGGPTNSSQSDALHDLSQFLQNEPNRDISWVLLKQPNAETNKEFVF